MKFLATLLLSLSTILSPALGELTYTVEATQDGVPIPKSDIKLTPFEPGTIGNINRNTSAPSKGGKPSKLVRRTNPIAYSSNWCGSVRHTASTNQVKIVHGQFQHPPCTRRTGATYPQAAATWVGIDGDSYTSALLQAGTVCKIMDGTSAVVNEVWWQWVPSTAVYVTSMSSSLAAGDLIDITINTTSTTAGKVTIKNTSKGQQYTMTISSGPTLARVDADWIVERPVYGSSLAGFANFNDVWFENAYGKLVNNANLGILGAKQYQISGTCSSQEYDDATLEAWAL